VSNDDVWRNLKQRIRRGADSDQLSPSVDASRGRGSVDTIGWNWGGPEKDPEPTEPRHESPSTGAHSTSVVSVGYRAELPGVDDDGDDRGTGSVRTSRAGEHDPVDLFPVDETPTARQVPEHAVAGRPTRSRRPVGRMVAPTTTDEDLERMAHQLLFGLGDRHDQRLVGGSSNRDSAENSPTPTEPLAVIEVAVPLSEVAGIGVTIAERLVGAGYDSAQALAGITDDQIDDLAYNIGTFPTRVCQWVERARELTAPAVDLTLPSK
jgi:predicted flap endonuclease-1-like 5' DNA nuclease